MTLRDIVKSGAEELGLSLSIEQINSIFIYLTELKKWNQKINLTGIRDERDSLIKNVLDSFSYVKGFTPAPGLTLLDMGSGAGFPALPIKIAYPGISITMVDSVKKKASFLRHIVRTLQLPGVTVLDKRTEEISSSLHATFDIVTARAFADMASALSAGTPFLRPDGRIVLSRGPEESLPDEALAKRGVAVAQRIDLTLPHSDHKRVIWVFTKCG